jgi:hypothetical protein
LWGKKYTNKCECLAILTWCFVYHIIATTALAQTTSTPVSRYCSTSNGDVCGSINVPDSGSDLFFQVKGSTDPGWVAVGVGSGMAGALIFVIYPSADGKNVTVSPRLGTYVDMRKRSEKRALLTFLW